MKRLPRYLFLAGLMATLSAVSSAQTQPVKTHNATADEGIVSPTTDTVGVTKLDTTVSVSIQATLIDPQVLDSLKTAIDTTLIPNGATLEPVTDQSIDKTDDAPVQSRKTTLLKQSVYRGDAFTLSGQIIDGTTGETAPYASVRVNKLGLGTVSNIDGNWTLRLPASAANEELTVKYLGYGTQTLNISRLPDNSVICLEPAAYELRQVVVTPEKKFEVLRAAWNAIKTNYPSTPTLTEGFYRETQRVTDSLFLYFNEAVLNVYKNTYKNSQNFGQIEVVKSRKNVFPGIDSINDVRFYGGPHFPNDLDVVFSRWDFINPTEFRNWNYELEGAYRNNDQYIYTISFKHKTKPFSNFQGQVFIDGDSYAYLGFEFKRFGVGSIAMEDIPTDVSYISGTTTIKVSYVEKDNLYYLNHINYKTNGINTASKIRVFKDIEYITTAIKTETVTPIPYDRQFDYTDILSIKADNYDQSYWKDYTILQESKVQSNQAQLLYGDQQAIEQLTKVYNTELTEQEKILLFLKRFTFEGGFSYHPLSFQGGRYHISYGADSFDPLNPPTIDAIKSSHFGLSTTDGIRFELNKHWSLVGMISTALYGVDQLQTSVGVNYRLSVLPSGRWVFLDLGLSPSYSTSKQRLGDMTLPGGSITIGSKTLHSSKLDVKAGQTSFDAKGALGLAVRMGKQYELFVEGTYLYPLISRNFVQLKETSGSFLGRSKAKVDWNDSNLFMRVDEAGQQNFNRVNQSRFNLEPWYIRLGIRSGF